jgi:hypothetical protein
MQKQEDLQNKLILPRPYISWSSLNCWISSPARFRKEYFWKKDSVLFLYLNKSND